VDVIKDGICSKDGICELPSQRLNCHDWDPDAGTLRSDNQGTFSSMGLCQLRLSTGTFVENLGAFSTPFRWMPSSIPLSLRSSNLKGNLGVIFNRNFKFHGPGEKGPVMLTNSSKLVGTEN
jgi:hypothetical protein